MTPRPVFMASARWYNTAMFRGHCRCRCPGLAGLVCLLALGCAADPHAQVVRDQTALYREMQAILAEIQDSASLEKAKARLLERMGRFQQVADRAGSLGLPPRDFSDRNAQLIGDFKDAVNQYVREVGRIQALKLPGGEEFLAEFKQPKS